MHSRCCIQQDAQPSLQLRILTLEHVTIIVADDSALTKFPEIQAARWTAAKKNEMAEEMRVELLDPDGAASLRSCPSSRQDQGGNSKF